MSMVPSEYDKGRNDEFNEHCRDYAALLRRATKMEGALRRIRGWREIGSADTPREKLTAIEAICDEALGQE